MLMKYLSELENRLNSQRDTYFCERRIALRTCLFSTKFHYLQLNTSVPLNYSRHDDPLLLIIKK